MRFARPIAATLLGVALGTIPFLRYWHADTGADAHMNHESRYGGQLAMIGDHHLELRLRDGRAEVWVSDGFRRPLRARSTSIRFGSGPDQEMEWSRHRFVAAAQDAPTATATVTLPSGERHTVEFTLAE